MSALYLTVLSLSRTRFGFKVATLLFRPLSSSGPYIPSSLSWLHAQLSWIWVEAPV